MAGKCNGPNLLASEMARNWLTKEHLGSPNLRAPGVIAIGGNPL
jgi:hypothetical protein